MLVIEEGLLLTMMGEMVLERDGFDEVGKIQSHL